LPVFYLHAAKAIVNIFDVSTITLERLLTAMGIEKVQQWFLERKVRNCFGGM
jgi:NAD-dependent DNA ligase